MWNEIIFGPHEDEDIIVGQIYNISVGVMHSLIMKISHSLGLKDTIAVGRGLYRVVEGGLETARINNRRDCSEKVLNSHKDLPIEPIKHYYHPDIQEPSFKTEETIHLKQKDEREKTIPSPSAQSTQQDFPHKK